MQTFLVGLEVAAQTEQLAFGPAIACNVDRISARVRTAFANGLRAWMKNVSASRAPR